MTKGMDRAAPLSSKEAAMLAQFGYTFAARYYSDLDWKRLTKAEALRINAAGMYVVAVFQNANNAPSKFSAAIGRAHAQSAVRQGEAIGQPKGLPPIYFAVDFEAVKPDELAAVADYFRAIVPILKAANYPVGVYGSYGVCEYVRKNVTGVKYFFQTLAWSHGVKLKSPGLYQKKCDVVLPEYPPFGRVDLVDSNGAGGGFKVTAAKEAAASGQPR